MRIISGHARGLKLKPPQGQAIRPTSDRAREALFNIINHRPQDALVLDLFAGTGAFGLEALSRGAKHVTFVDNNPNALILIKKNLLLLQKSVPLTLISTLFPEKVSPDIVCQSASILKCDLSRESFFISIERKNTSQFFDLIFLDPPYAKGLSLQTLTYIDKNQFLADQGVLIAEECSGIELPHNLNTLTMIDKRKYGDTGFWFYKKH